MVYLYIKFANPGSKGNLVRNNTIKQILRNLLAKTLATVIPKANPEFDNEVDYVAYWLIEVDVDKGFPNREIGLSKFGEVLAIMPWRNNYGYWTDSNLLLNDFRKHFDAIDITKEEFEKYWQLFDQKIK